LGVAAGEADGVRGDAVGAAVAVLEGVLVLLSLPPQASTNSSERGAKRAIRNRTYM
jgi:hypothetical protein